MELPGGGVGRDLERLEKLDVLIREKRIPIANLDLLRPGEVVAALEDRVPFHVHMTGHTNAWRHFGVRPPTGDPHPERTRSEYCVYDAAHGDYLYTSAWVEKLVREFSSAQRFIEITKQSRTD